MTDTERWDMDEHELAWVEGITRSGLDLNFFHADKCIIRLREIDAFSDARALSDRAVFRIRCRCTDVLAVDLERMCVQLIPRTKLIALDQIKEPALIVEQAPTLPNRFTMWSPTTGITMRLMDPNSLCPDLLSLDYIGEADSFRGEVVRGFFWLMRFWPKPTSAL